MNAAEREENFRRLIEFNDLGEALRHATEAGFGIKDVAYIFRDAPFDPGVGRIAFRIVPDGALVAFSNEGLSAVTYATPTPPGQVAT